MTKSNLMSGCILVNFVLSVILVLLALWLLKAIYDMFFSVNIDAPDEAFEDDPIEATDLFDPEAMKDKEPIFTLKEFTRMRKYIDRTFVFSKELQSWVDVQFIPEPTRSDVLTNLSPDDELTDEGKSDFDPERDDLRVDVNRSSLSVFINPEIDEDEDKNKKNKKDKK